jgi:hypothetical protein
MSNECCGGNSGESKKAIPSLGKQEAADMTDLDGLDDQKEGISTSVLYIQASVF